MRDQDFAFLILDIPIALTRPQAEITARSAEIGRDSGLDDDWVPETIEAAAWEILLSSGSVSACHDAGVVPLPDLIGTNAADELLSLRIELRVTEDEREIEAMTRLLPADWPRSFEVSVLAVLMAPTAPLDHGVEIVDYATPKPASRHAEMARVMRIDASRRYRAD